MKKGIVFVLILSLLMIIVSCSTSVGVSYMKPSDVDMGKYRNIAIAPTVPYKGYIPYPTRVRYLDAITAPIYIAPSYKNNLPQKIADYATDSLVSALSDTGYFKILDPSMTEVYLNIGSIGYYNTSKELLKNGYDAVMIPKIENMDIDEVIWASIDSYKVDKNGVKFPVYEYYIKRIAKISYSITVIDCNTDKIVARKLYEDSMQWSDDFDPDWPVFTTDAYYMFRSMINGFRSTILRNFVPRKVVENLSLMSNKPKLESAKIAYEVASNGNLGYAYELFINLWNNEHHIPSGYNAALIKGALGDYDSALALLSEMQKSVSNSSVSALYSKIYNMKKSTAEAEAQIEGKTTELENATGYSIYDYLLSN